MSELLFAAREGEPFGDPLRCCLRHANLYLWSFPALRRERERAHKIKTSSEVPTYYLGRAR